MRQRNLTIAKVFLFGQLLAFGVFALLTAADALAAGKVGYALPPILVFGIATSAVVYFRLASRLSEGLSVRRLSVVALGISLLGLILAFRHFRLLTDLGGSMATSSGLGRLSTTATLALVAFGLAFLAVLATVVFVRGPSEG
jgi:hypothetical protein